MTTVATKPYSCSRLQQLEQGNHVWAQTMAQPGWQCLQAARYVLDQGSSTRQVDISEINLETSLRSHPPNWRGNDKEGAGSQGIHLLLTKRGSSWKRAQKVLIYLPAPSWVCIAWWKDSQRESSLDCILMYSHLQQSRYELTHD